MTISALNRRWRPPVLLAIWLAALVLLWVDIDWLHTVAASSLGAVVVLSLLDARRETLAVFALIASLGVLLIWAGADAGEMLRGLDRTLIFAGMLPTLAMTRTVARGLPAVRTAQHRIASLPERLSGIGLLFGAHAFGAVLNTGSFAFMASVIPDGADEKQRWFSALASLRGMNTVALYSPFLVGFAVVYTYVPEVPVWQAFLLGGSMAICGLVISLLIFARPLSFDAVRQGLACLAPIGLLMVVVGGLVIAGSQIFPITTLGAVLMVMPVLCAIHLIQQPHRISEVYEDTKGAMSTMGDDLLIVSTSLVLGTLAETAPPILDVVAPWIGSHLPTWAVFSAVAGSMVLFAILGVHPMITGTVMMVAVTSSDLPVAHLPLMTAMLFGWGMGAMSSISSLTVVTAGRLFGVRPITLALGPNLIYVGVFFVFTMTVLTLLNAVMTG
ncbi:hypothetical protein T8K17_14745 [Thalassobaculum sp. OXR-137]|uniref:hypothetical protein n=1 Tax=Thalassobaculum sp. OXR-137 TaxID=3100173 RepID=UPI002AC9D679|nr:hypothetical protein [Thalassobaculum sp. OXR-137]WPZ32499.1 hypothetical protein T8K17_14745 [Thalassobaculum sp. OXR-137]